MPAVKIGASRQVVIPKRLYDELGLAPGDYLEVELSRGKLTFTPKTLVDKVSAGTPLAPRPSRA
jgi:AbrB family looped-hinge helix DNA binding protein